MHLILNIDSAMYKGLLTNLVVNIKENSHLGRSDNHGNFEINTSMFVNHKPVLTSPAKNTVVGNESRQFKGRKILPVKRRNKTQGFNVIIPKTTISMQTGNTPLYGKTNQITSNKEFYFSQVEENKSNLSIPEDSKNLTFEKKNNEVFILQKLMNDIELLEKTISLCKLWIESGLNQSSLEKFMSEINSSLKQDEKIFPVKSLNK